MAGLEHQLLQAMDLVAQQKVNSLTFDKSIRGVIVEYTDPVTRQYQVQYQDSKLIAFCNDATVEYKVGDSVYVLVPNNNFNERKTITGLTAGIADSNSMAGWFLSYEPLPTIDDQTHSNGPADTWISEAQKIAHLGDLFYNLTDGTSYIYKKDSLGGTPETFVYYWQPLTSNGILALYAEGPDMDAIGDYWHTLYVDTDIYMKQSIDKGKTWQGPIKITGQPGISGDSVDVSFVRSLNPPSPNPPLPSPGTPTGWYTDVNSANTNGSLANPLWSSTGVKNSGEDNYTWMEAVKVSGGIAIELSVYGRNSVVPSTPTGGTYNFSTGVLTPPTGNITWTSTVPAGIFAVYTSRVVVSTTVGNPNDVVISGWSSATLSVQNGTDGAGANSVSIGTSSQVFKSLDDGVTYTPSVITLTPTFQTVTYSKWQYSTNGGISGSFLDVSSGVHGLTITGNVLTVPNNSDLFTFLITSLVFKVITSGTVTDSVTITRLQNGKVGAGNITAILSNEVAPVSCTDTGTPTGVYTGTDTTIKVFEGINELTGVTSSPGAGQYTITKTVVNVTPGIITYSGSPTYAHSATITGMGGYGTADTGSITFTISGFRADGTVFPSFTKVQSFTKSKTGVKGFSPLSATLTAQAIAFPATSTGIISQASLALGNGNMRVYRDGIEITNSGHIEPIIKYEISYLNNAFGVMDENTGMYSVSDVTLSAPGGIATMIFKATDLTIGDFVNATMSITVVKDGAKGEDGPPSTTPGPTGNWILKIYKAADTLGNAGVPSGSPSWAINHWEVSSGWSEIMPDPGTTNYIWTSTGTITSANTLSGSWSPVIQSKVVADYVVSKINIDTPTISNNMAVYNTTPPVSPGGFWMGLISGFYKFIIGNSTNYLSWDGVNLVVKGGAVTGSLVQTDIPGVAGRTTLQSGDGAGSSGLRVYPKSTTAAGDWGGVTTLSNWTAIQSARDVTGGQPSRAVIYLQPGDSSAAKIYHPAVLISAEVSVSSLVSGGTLDISGDTTLNSDLSVAGASALTGLSVTYNIIAGYHITAGGNLTVGGDIIQMADARISSATWHIVGTSGAASYGTGGSAYIASPTNHVQNAKYMKDALGFVHLAGYCKVSSLATTIFTLPVGFRPNYQHTFSCIANHLAQRVTVETTGAVSLYNGSGSTFLSLDGIVFLPDA